MSTIINHPHPGDGADPPDLPSPERRAALSAFAGLLFELYGPDRSSWPHPDEWPWQALQGGAR